MGMYNQFATSKKLETEGITIDYGDFKVVVARAGGSNDRFLKSLEHKTRPIRRAIETNTVDRNKVLAAAREAFAETCVLDWQSKTGTDEDGQPIYAQGIEAPDGGDLLEFNAKNVIATFIALPELFNDLQEQAAKMANFRMVGIEDEAKN